MNTHPADGAMPDKPGSPVSVALIIVAPYVLFAGLVLLGWWLWP